MLLFCLRYGSALNLLWICFSLLVLRYKAEISRDLAVKKQIHSEGKTKSMKDKNV